MALQTVRIGAIEDAFQYDDGDFDSAIETTQPLKAGTPVDPTDVLRLTDIGATVGNVFGPGAATDNAIVRWNGAGGYTIQNSLVTLDDAGSISLPAGESIDGMDPSVHKASVGDHTDVDYTGLSNDDLLQWNDPGSKWEGKSIAEVILSQNINPGNITMNDGATIGQVAGPLIEFDDTNNYLEITGCDVGIGTTSPAVALHIYDLSANGHLRVEGNSPTIQFAESDGSADENWQLRVVSGDLCFQTQNDAFGAADTKVYITQNGAMSVSQENSSGAEYVLYLRQEDISEEFIRFNGEAASGVLTQSIVNEGDQASETREGWLKVYVVDDGNQITDQAYYIPIYTLS